MHEVYFSKAPEFYATCKITERKDDKRENIYHDLLIADIIKYHRNAEVISLNDLVSFDVSAKIGTSQIIFNMRDIIYCTTVIPHMLLPWKVHSVIRRPLLLIGEEKAGKTAWCCAIAKQCAAAHICISAKNFAIKGAKKLRYTIEQFAKRDGYCVVEIDRLEVFSSSKKRKSAQKTILCSLFEQLKRINAQVIGSSRSVDIDEDIAAFFPNVIILSNPDHLARFQLICDHLSRRLESERLPKIPSRLSDFCKVTQRMNCGATVARVIDSMTK
uniref:ATPase AAA-type core domain-containing protein n=1 Tax=Parascaris univalens TaxID=6257 RepID=A0A915BDE1_PARUN